MPKRSARSHTGLLIEALEERRLLTNTVFAHPGVLDTAADFTRMATKVAANEQPWLADWNMLTSDGLAQLGASPRPQVTITRGGTGSQNYGLMWGDIRRAFDTALRWKVTGDINYANQTVTFLNAWASTNTTITGDSNASLAFGLYGFQWANIAEMMRSYSGWAAADQTQFQNYLLNVYIPGNQDLLVNHHGTDPTHYWANWDLCNIASEMAIGVFCDRHDLYANALSYLYTGIGNGALDKVIYYMHPGNLGQGQEEGRDQGHSGLDFAMLGEICQTAWNQGDDIFSYKNNEILAGVEYFAKYNLGNDVPFTDYSSSTGGFETGISSGSRGNLRPMLELFYNHYVIMEGLSAPYTTEAVLQHTRPEWDYGNGDEYSWGTLLFALDPDPAVHAPQNLVGGYEKGAGNIQINWWGGANDTTYKVYRGTSAAGPFTQIASGLTAFTYTDSNLPAGTYYYKVTGVNGATETAATNVVSATSTNALVSQLKFDESSGATASDSVGSLTGTLNGGATFVPGKTGNAVSLDGSSGYVSLPAGAIAGLADYTIATWVYLNGTPATWSRIFDFGDGRGDWMFLTPKSGSGTLEFATSDTYNYNKQSIDVPTLATNQWVHLAVTFSNRLATMYVNGVAVGSNANMDFEPYEIDGGMPNNWIGRSQFSSDPYLNGKVDDFRIYRGALPAGQVYTLATGNAAPAVPAAPASLTATAVVGNTINLSWPAVAGATSYSVYRSTSSSGPFWPVQTLITTASYSDTGLPADLNTGTPYYYRVTAANNGGEGAMSPQASAVALPPLPTAPTGLAGKSATSTSVLLNWSAASNDVTYNVKRGSTSGGPYTTITSGLTATTYTDNTVSPGNTYYYVISSTNAAGAGANSVEAPVIVSDRLVRLKLDDGAGTLALDSSGNGWNGTLVNGPTWTAGKFNGAVHLDGTDDYASLPTGVLSGITAITISAWVNLDSNASAWTRIFDFGSGTATNMFLTPHNGANGFLRFGIKNNNSAEQQINTTYTFPTGVWTHVAVTMDGATTNGVGRLYVNGVQLGTNSGFTFNAASMGSTTQNYLGKSQYADPYLQGSIDDFRIYTRVLSSSEINTLYTGTVPAAPSSLTATAGAGQVMLNWPATSGATSYNVLRSSTSGGPYTLLDSGVAGTSCVDNGLVGNGSTTYYYVVTATNDTGDSANSPQASATPAAATDLWGSADIGSVGATGSSAHAGNVFSLAGSGADIWGAADAFRYTYRTLSGDGAIVARVASINATDPWAKSGLMMRESLAANAKNVLVAVTPGNGVTSQERPTTGGATDNTAVAGMAAPYWLKLQRAASTFTTYSSPDGVVWTLRATYTISMATTIFVGLADTAHNSTLSNASTFDHVFITPNAPTNLSATVPPGEIDLSWTPSLDAQSYSVKRATTSGGPYTTIATGVVSSAYNDTTAVGSDPYYYVVTAVNLAGESVASNEVSQAVFPDEVAGTADADHFYVRRSGANLQVWVGGAGDGSGSPTYSTTFASLTSLQFDGNGGNDIVTVDYAGGSPVPGGGLNVDGGAAGGADSLIVLGTAAGDGFTIDASQIASTASAGTIAYANITTVEFDLLGGNDTLTQAAQPTAAVTYHGGSGNDVMNVNAGTFAFTGDAGAASASLTVNVNNVGSLATFTGSQHLAALNLSAGGAATLTASASAAAPAVLNVSSLVVVGGGSTLNLTNNEMLAGSSLAAIRSLIATGNLVSSSGSGGLGSLDLGAGTVEVRFTLLGDTNLDGTVDVTDLGNLASSYGATGGASWVQGDTNYDNGVDVTDLGNLASNYGASLGDGGAAASAAEIAASPASTLAASAVASSSAKSPVRATLQVATPATTFSDAPWSASSTTPLVDGLFDRLHPSGARAILFADGPDGDA